MGADAKPPVEIAARIRRVVKDLKLVRSYNAWSEAAQKDRRTIAQFFEREARYLTGQQDQPPEFDLRTMIALADAARISLRWFAIGEGLPVESDAAWRYDSLRDVVTGETDRQRWSPSAIAAIRARAYDAQEDPGGEYWRRALDAADALLRAGLPPFPASNVRSIRG